MYIVKKALFTFFTMSFCSCFSIASAQSLSEPDLNGTAVMLTQENIKMGALWEELFQYYHDLIVLGFSNQTSPAYSLKIGILSTIGGNILKQITADFNPTIGQPLLNFYLAGNNFLSTMPSVTLAQWLATIPPLVTTLVMFSNEPHNMQVQQSLTNMLTILVNAVNNQLQGYTNTSTNANDVAAAITSWEYNTNLANNHAKQIGHYLSILFGH